MGAGLFPCRMGKLETCLSRPVPFGGPAGPGRPCNGFAVLHAVAAVPVHGLDLWLLPSDLRDGPR